ncbi:hypothetical protein V5799_021235 [Amblyomma americanum]|uniref:Peptidase M13 N-terminal domain-containing protein n=1 Tax=Amblyomma americanum TaxID=6943 RepID=A0AAQ4FR59_AMBAM
MKTGLLRPLVMAFFATVPISVVLLSLILAKIMLPDPSGVPCQTHECREYGRRLASSLNASVNPCHSFTHFVCDGWQRDNVLSVQHDLIWQTLDRVGRLVRHIDIPRTEQNDVQRAAAVYKSCDDVLHGRRDELPAVKGALAEAGVTWPHRPVNIDVLHVLLYSSLRLGWDVFLRVVLSRVEGRDMVIVDKGASFPQLSERYMMQKSTREKEDYFNAFKRAFANADNENASEAVSFKQTTSLEAHGISSLLKSYGFEKTPTDQSLSWLDKLRISSLAKSSWLRVFDELGFNVTGDFSLRVLTSAYLKAFVELWRLLGELNLYWLVSWGMVQVAALYSNRDLILKLYGGPPIQVSVRHGAFCLSRAYKFSRHALFTKYASELLPEYTIYGAEQLTLKIRESVRQLLSSWIHYSNSIAVVANWSSLERNFGAFRGSNEHSRNHNANASGSLPSLQMAESFVENWRKSVLVSEWDGWDADIISAMVSLQFAALRLRDDFQVVPFSMSFLHYDADLANMLNFGGLGFLVALALGRLFLGAYQQDEFKSQYVNALLDCIKAGAFSRGPNHENSMAEIITGRAVVDTYVKGAKQYYDQLEELKGYEGTQLLFIASCYLKCEGSYVGNSDGLCDMSFQYLPEFAEAFQCSPGTPMNPMKLCSLPEFN